jgi:hypothetical protein
VPEPDPVARDYLLLALRIDQHTPGIVDGYDGPASLKAQVDLEQLRPPAALVADASALLERLDRDVAERDRRSWLAGQVRALGTLAEVLAGGTVPYLELTERLFEWSPVRRDPAVFEDAAREIDRLVPGDGSIAERLAAWDARFTLPTDRIVPVGDWLVATFRDRVAATIGVPDGEAIRIRLVHGQPWSAYDWYEGGRRSRFDVNTDLPVRAADLIHLAAHEAYPGHHLEHAWKEAELVDRLGRLEASIRLVNTPESLISEGLADLGHALVSPPTTEAELLVEVFARGGLTVAADRGAARDAAERMVALRPLRRRLDEARVNAALLRHADGSSHDDVLRFLQDVGRFAPAVAAKRLEFIEHPLWRTSVFVNFEGEALLRQWLEAVPPGERPMRFGRLLREELGPSAIAAEVAALAPGDAVPDGRAVPTAASGSGPSPSSPRRPRASRSR